MATGTRDLWTSGNLRSLGPFFLTLAAFTAAGVLRGPHWGDDAVVLVVFVLLNGAGLRAGVALVSVLAFVLAFPPFQWPLYWICFAPLTWLWCESQPVNGEWAKEAFSAGFAMCWLSMPFVRGDFPTFGLLIQALASSLFGLQLMAIATALRWSRNRAMVLSVPLVALIAAGCEVLRMVGLRWPLLAISSPAAGTPVAQWACLVSPFGVSFLIYALNFSCLPRGASFKTRRAWIAPSVALVLASSAWFGGHLLAGAVRVEPVPLSALLVQPNRAIAGSETLARQVIAQLERQTRSALQEGSPVDLVIWPEGSIGLLNRRQDLQEAKLKHQGTQSETAEAILTALASETRTPYLAGAIIGTEDGRPFNSALLVTPEGRVQRYDKRMLVVGAESIYTPGGPYQCLQLRTPGARKSGWESPSASRCISRGCPSIQRRIAPISWCI